jgi:hypothetical protein
MPKAPKTTSEFEAIIAELGPLAERALTAEEPSSTDRQVLKVRTALADAAYKIRAASERLDPILRPDSIFDPTDPSTAGRVVALTLVAQDRHPLGHVPEFYGAGVYAIYYTGKFAAYSSLAGTDHPIYVGKADPDSLAAKDAVAQGPKLSARLNEHAKSIRAATSTLNIADFECRFLIVQTGFQKSAEDYLIGFFKPIWNSETKICFGLGKHGDSSSTRGNKRSPWDTLHPGRPWAESTTEDQKPVQIIRDQIKAHFLKHPAYVDIHAIFDRFVSDMRQLSLERFRTPAEPRALSTAEAFGEVKKNK